MLLSNSDCLVQHVSSEKHEISDHNLVEIMIPTTEIFSTPTGVKDINEVEPQGFRALNLFNADFSRIADDLDQVDWEHLWSQSTLEDFPKLLYDVVLEVCKKSTPLKIQFNKDRISSHQRSYRTILRKKLS